MSEKPGRVDHQAEMIARLKTNKTVRALNAMWEGGFKDFETEAKEDWSNSWKTASSTQREIVMRVLEGHREWVRPPEAIQGRDTFQRIMLSSVGFYSSASSELVPTTKGVLPRGAICPAKLEEISFPRKEKLYGHRTMP